MGLRSGCTQSLQRGLELVLARQGKGAGVATLEANGAAGQTAQGMRHDGPPALRVPGKDIVRAEVEAAKILPAEVVINAWKPGDSRSQTSEWGHQFSFTRHRNNRTGYSAGAFNGVAWWDRRARRGARESGPGCRHWWYCGYPEGRSAFRRIPCCAGLS